MGLGASWAGLRASWEGLGARWEEPRAGWEGLGAGWEDNNNKPFWKEYMKVVEALPETSTLEMEIEGHCPLLQFCGGVLVYEVRRQ